MDIKDYINYDPETGAFTYKKVRKRGSSVGDIAGYLHSRGYWIIGFEGKYLQASRVAHYLMTGEWPVEEIDHINRVRDDNRWCNLRPASRSLNNYNKDLHPLNKSGIAGVNFHKQSGRWAVRTKGDQKYFRTLLDAAAMRISWENDYVR